MMVEGMAREWVKGTDHVLCGVLDHGGGTPSETILRHSSRTTPSDNSPLETSEGGLGFWDYANTIFRPKRKAATAARLLLPT